MSSPLKPQDIFVLLKLVALENQGFSWQYQPLAQSLYMSASEVHGAVSRAEVSTLVEPHRRSVDRYALDEFLVHGLRYAFPAGIGRVAKGLPTAESAPPLAQRLTSSVVYVWPHPDGPQTGMILAPLYRSAPAAALLDPLLYELLALADVLRVGQSAERETARNILREHLLKQRDVPGAAFLAPRN